MRSTSHSCLVVGLVAVEAIEVVEVVLVRAELLRVLGQPPVVAFAALASEVDAHLARAALLTLADDVRDPPRLCFGHQRSTTAPTGVATIAQRE